MANLEKLRTAALVEECKERRGREDIAGALDCLKIITLRDYYNDDEVAARFLELIWDYGGGVPTPQQALERESFRGHNETTH